MKRISLILIIFSLLIFSSCQKESISRTGFNTLFNKDSNGLTLLFINSHIDSIHLEGRVRIDEGQLDIKLINPKGNEVYSMNFQANINVEIDKHFKAESGFWKLKYISRDGIGAIDLHIRE